MIRTEQSLGLDRATARRDPERLRALLQQLLELHHWSEIRDELVGALTLTFGGGGLDCQRFLMTTFEMDELLGLDVDILPLLSSVTNPNGFDDLRRQFSQHVIRLVEKQIEDGGSTLLFDLDRMLHTSAAVLVPSIAESRNSEMQNVAAYQLKDIIDLRDLWLTGNGHRILSAMRTHLVTSIENLEVIREELKRAGLDLRVRDFDATDTRAVKQPRISDSLRFSILKQGQRDSERIPSSLVSSLVGLCRESADAKRLSLLSDVIRLEDSPYPALREVLQEENLVNDTQVRSAISELISHENQPWTLFKMLKKEKSLLEQGPIQKAIAAAILSSVNPQRAIEAIAEESSIWRSHEVQVAVSSVIESWQRPWAIVRALGAKGLVCSRPVIDAIVKAVRSVADPSNLISDVLRTPCLREDVDLLMAIVDSIESDDRKWPLTRDSVEAILTYPDLLPPGTIQKAVADFVRSPKTRYRDLDVLTMVASITESEVAQEAIADLIERVDEPLLVLHELRKAQTLMRGRIVQEAVESRIPVILDEIRRADYPWRLVAVIKDVEALASDQAVQREIAQSIKDAEDPWRIVRALGESKTLLDSPEIKASIASLNEGE
ncbi:MAG: hypothetical protein ACFFCK_09865 [Promethearchaeota archaeon]